MVIVPHARYPGKEENLSVVCVMVPCGWFPVTCPYISPHTGHAGFILLKHSFKQSRQNVCLHFGSVSGLVMGLIQIAQSSLSSADEAAADEAAADEAAADEAAADEAAADMLVV